MRSLETKRLILRKFKTTDVKAVYDYAKLDTVGPMAGWKPHKNKKETRAVIDNFIKKDDVYALVFKDTRKVIGSIGVHLTELGSLGEVYELGYVLHPKFHRMGLMTEAIDIILYEVFFERNIDCLYVGHFYENLASQKLIEKIGFEWIEDILYQSRDYGEKKAKIYQLTKLNFVLMKGEK